MNRKVAHGVFFLVMAVAGLVGPGMARAQQRGEGQRPRPAWWLDQSIAAQMNLSGPQKERIDAIFRSSEAGDSVLLKELVALREQLDALVAKADAEESAVFAAIDRVEHLRYQISRNRVFMLYRIHRCLTPEQRAVLAKIAKERNDHRQAG